MSRVTVIGAGFAALSAMNNGVGEAQHRNVIAESIDAAVARKLPGIFPLLNLGIDPGKPETKAVLCSSAWGPGRPIAAQCRPELAYESLFGTVGADRNERSHDHHGPLAWSFRLRHQLGPRNLLELFEHSSTVRQLTHPVKGVGDRERKQG